MNYFKISLNSLSYYISFLYVFLKSIFVEINITYSNTSMNFSITYIDILFVLFTYNSNLIYSNIIYNLTNGKTLNFYSKYFFYFKLPNIISNYIGKQLIYYLILIINDLFY